MTGQLTISLIAQGALMDAELWAGNLPTHQSSGQMTLIAAATPVRAVGEVGMEGDKTGEANGGYSWRWELIPRI